MRANAFPMFRKLQSVALLQTKRTNRSRWKLAPFERSLKRLTFVPSTSALRGCSYGAFARPLFGINAMMIIAMLHEPNVGFPVFSELMPRSLALMFRWCFRLKTEGSRANGQMCVRCFDAAQKSLCIYFCRFVFFSSCFCCRWMECFSNSFDLSMRVLLTLIYRLLFCCCSNVNSGSALKGIENNGRTRWKSSTLSRN